MTSPTVQDLANSVGFDLPAQYNASRLLWDNLPDNPDRPAILHDSGTWTYAELAAEAARVGNHLLTISTPGDRILLFIDDEPTYPAAIMGAMRAGMVPILTNTLSPPDLIRFFLEDSGATAAIISDAYRDLFTLDTIRGVACKDVLVTGERPWANAETLLSEHPTVRRDPAFWMYSSGSTGRPKGVVHKHEDAAYTAETYGAHVLNLTPDDICFSIPKIFFAYGFGNAVTFPMSRGAATVLLTGRPDPSRVFEQITRHRPTVLFGLPTLYTMLVHSDAAETASLDSVRLCISAAEILSEEVAELWKARFGLKIIEGLGSTEILHIYLSNDAQHQKVGSAGRAVPGYAVRLVTLDGRDAATGEEGIMHVRGLSGAETYWNRPDKTAETMHDGWLVTGDRFVQDEDGYYFFRGRADDLVKVSGQWVYPLEIELALNEHPKVRECCVQAVQLRDQRLTIKAWVALARAQCASNELTKELQAYAKSRLLPHKYPREIIYLETLPKTGTGKIDRQALRRQDGAAD
jgi:benzoate-CoA ligase family protein